MIESLRKSENMTVFLTTHYMEESADADYVVILDSGKISAEGTPLELKINILATISHCIMPTKNTLLNLVCQFKKFLIRFVELKLKHTRGSRLDCFTQRCVY